jgi:6-phospho-3-hexuloisomerase
VEKLMIEKNIQAILSENRSLLQTLSPEAAGELIRLIKKSRAIFFSAQGRSGFVLRCFCMRLMHLGYQVYFCGETITPAIGETDLLIVLSGSGYTTSTFEAVQIAKKKGAMTCGILANLHSRISPLLDKRIHIPGTTKLGLQSEPHSLQMAGSLFEQSAFIFLEAAVLALYQEKLKETGGFSELHTDFE